MITYLSELLVRACDEDGVEDGFIGAPLSLAGGRESLGVSLGLAFIDALVLVAVGHAEGNAQPFEVAGGVALQVRL